MPAEVLREYLVSLGWDIKNEQLKKLDTAVAGTEAVLKRFALSFGTGATTIALNVQRTAEQLDRLYFAAQRIGTTAFQLQQFSYAARQIGIAGEEMQGAISAVGIAMRMPGQAGLLRSLGAQSNDAATALDQLIGRLRQMPYFIGQNFAQQFGIGPQAYYQYVTQYDRFHRELQDRQRRAGLAGNTPADAENANSLMTRFRQIQDELGQIEQKIFRALVDPLKEALGYAEPLLEKFSKIDDKLAAALVLGGASVGAVGAFGLARGLGRMIFGGGAGAAATAASGASLSAAAEALMGSAAALNEAAIALGAKGAIPALPIGGAPAAPQLRSGGAVSLLFGMGLPMLGIGQMLGEEFRAHPERYPHLQPGFLHNRFFPQGGGPLPGDAAYATIPPSTASGLRRWITGDVMRGGINAEQDASNALRDWLHGSSSFVPRVQLLEGTPGSTATPGGSSGGFWGSVRGALGWARQHLSPISTAHAALPPDAAAHMAGIGLGPEAAATWYTGSASAHEAEHGGFNFAGTRHPQGGFRTYPSEFAGVADAARLLRDYKAKGFDTLEKIISRWAPPNENNTGQLIGRAEQWMGVKRDQPLDLNNPEMLTRLLGVMNRNEFGGNRTVSPEALQRHVRNYLGNLGGSGGTGGTGGGAYGVQGAVMNLGNLGGVGAPGSNLTRVVTSKGHSFIVNKAAAPAFQAFVEDLEGRGYNIGSIGGYNYRNIRGGSQLSEHAYGLAIDINPEKNPLGSRKNDLPSDIHDLAAKYGLIWGGDWKSRPDPMHFQWGGSKPWMDDSAGALVPGGKAPGQSSVNIEMNNHFQVSGFEASDIGREVNRGLGRTNADLVRNLTSAVG